MSTATPRLQVQSRVNGLIVALPNTKDITGLAQHFNTRGDNELIFAAVKTGAKPRKTAAKTMKLDSPSAEELA